LDRDGKVAKGEWTGTEVAFLELDLDGNGVIDKRDRAEATAELPEQEAELPDVKGELLGVDEWMKRFDKDGNAVLSSKEITDKWLRAAMPFGDKDKDGSLKVTKTENGVNPLCFGQTALLGCDVWEHSYYIDFRNKRPAYLTNFLEKLVNWEAVAARM
jgi:hypothetical protein